ncbi:MAG: hypothetical protein V8S87_09865 [Oscillospiraceae bacterium]
MDKNYFERYNSRTHTIGHVSSVIVLVMLVGAPFLISTYLGAMPDLGAAAKAFISVGLVWTVSSVVEFLVYTPMLGAGGGYLAFITGNLINMKIPCAVNARDIVGAKTGTPENRDHLHALNRNLIARDDSGARARCAAARAAAAGAPEPGAPARV